MPAAGGKAGSHRKSGDAGKRVVNSGGGGAGIGMLGGVSERLSIPHSRVVHRCRLIAIDARSPSASSSSVGDCGNDGSLRFCGRVCSPISVNVVVRRGRFMRASGSSSSSTGEGDSERSDIEGDLRFRVAGLNQGCNCAGCTQ